MPTWYVDSTVTGSPNDGTSWDTAVETLQEAIALASAGDDFWIASDHNEVPGGNITYTFPGTLALPNRVISVNSGTDAYEVGGATPQIDNDGSAWDITFDGVVYTYGVHFGVGDDFTATGWYDVYHFEDCIFTMANASLGVIFTGATAGNATLFKNCTFNWDNGYFSHSSGILRVDGGIIQNISTQPAQIVDLGIRHSDCHFVGVDLTACNPSGGIVDASSTEVQHAIFDRCSLNTSATLVNGTPTIPGNRFLFMNCDDATGNALYRMDLSDYFGTVVADDTIYRNGGASDGTTPISWRFDSNANGVDGNINEALVSSPITAWCNTPGTRTFTINGIWDSQVDIENDEIWVEVEYLDSSTDTQAAFVSDGLANILATPVAQTTNTQIWTQPAGSPTAIQYPNEFQLNVTASVARVGPVIAKVYLAKPSTTVWVDPYIVVT